jgi:hypothetical protein
MTGWNYCLLASSRHHYSTIVKTGLGRLVGNNWQELVHVVQKRVKWAPTASRPATGRQRTCAETAHRHLTEVAGPPDEKEGITHVDPFRIL